MPNEISKAADDATAAFAADIDDFIARTRRLTARLSWRLAEQRDERAARLVDVDDGATSGRRRGDR